MVVVVVVVAGGALGVDDVDGTAASIVGGAAVVTATSVVDGRRVLGVVGDASEPPQPAATTAKMAAIADRRLVTTRNPIAVADLVARLRGHEVRGTGYEVRQSRYRLALVGHV